MSKTNILAETLAEIQELREAVEKNANYALTSTLKGELEDIVKKNLDEAGAGVFNIPGLMKIKVVRKPATEERKGINPFTKEETIFKAKPASNVVKIVPLKGLKDMV